MKAEIVYSANDEDYSNEDPEQLAYDALSDMDVGSFVVITSGEIDYDGEMHENLDGMDCFPVIKVKRYKSYTMGADDWPVEVSNEG